MKTLLYCLLALVGWSLIVPLSAESQPLTVHDTAQFLAGFRINRLPEESSAQAQAYRSALDQSWKRVDTNRLALMRTWAATELGSIRDQVEPVFYPFSGPDFVHVYAFFPHASVYVMGGLEPIGSLPDLTRMGPGDFSALYGEIQASMTTILAASFFKTNDMKKDLKQTQLNGVVPLLAIFMARSGLQVQQVTALRLTHEGALELEPAKPNGVRMVIQRPPEAPQTIYYFQVDVSNEGAQGPSLPRFIDNQGRGLTYLKSASYLMHRDGFSLVRSALLKNSQAVLEDDSGIPLRFFPATHWKVTAYGNYVTPIELFAQRYQPDLRAVYDRSPKPRPLPFGIGYKFRREESMLLWAVRTDPRSHS